RGRRGGDLRPRHRHPRRGLRPADGADRPTRHGAVNAEPRGDAADGPDAARYADAVLNGSRAGIARTITLVESSRPDHRILAQHVLTRLLPYADQARRIGVTGG